MQGHGGIPETGVGKAAIAGQEVRGLERGQGRAAARVATWAGGASAEGAAAAGK